MTSVSTGSVPVAGQEVKRVAGPQAPGQALLSFEISYKQLLLLLIKNKFLTLLTFGIYRFWAKTNLRQLFWQGVNIGGDRFDYMGTGKELFLGFLLAMAILLPSTLVLSLLFKFSGLSGPTAALLNQLVYVSLLYIFWQFARYRLWRYRMSRTAWRGIRFYLTGSAFGYAIRVFLLSLLSLVTLGWAYPAQQAYRLNYQLNNSHFGNGRFSYSGSVRGLYGIYWPLILGWQTVTCLLIAFVYHSGFIHVEGKMKIILDKARFTSQEDMLFLAIGVAFLFFFLFSFLARIWEFRYLARNIRFGRASFSSYLRGRSVLWIFAILFFVALLGYAGIIGIFIVLIKAKTELGIYLMGFFFFFAYVGVDILRTMFLLAPLLKVICATLRIHEFEAFEETAATSVNMPKYGEGFADALDVGAF